METVCLVFMTAPDEATAVALTRTVVDERLAACGNVVPTVRSIYRWQGEVHDDAEAMVLFKTTESAAGSLRARLVQLHPYDCPEVLVVNADGGHGDYLAWVDAMVGVTKT